MKILRCIPTSKGGPSLGVVHRYIKYNLKKREATKATGLLCSPYHPSPLGPTHSFVTRRFVSPSLPPLLFLLSSSSSASSHLLASSPLLVFPHPPLLLLSSLSSRLSSSSSHPPSSSFPLSSLVSLRLRVVALLPSLSVMQRPCHRHSRATRTGPHPSGKGRGRCGWNSPFCTCWGLCRGCVV